MGFAQAMSFQTDNSPSKDVTGLQAPEGFFYCMLLVDKKIRGVRLLEYPNEHIGPLIKDWETQTRCYAFKQQSDRGASGRVIPKNVLVVVLTQREIEKEKGREEEE